MTLDRFERIVLDTLFQIENEVVAAIRELFALLNSGKKLSPDAFEKKLARFGSALIMFDKFDQSTNKGQIGVNSIFAVFEALVRLAAKGAPANIAVLQVTSTVGDRKVEKLFLSDAAAES